MNTQKSASFNNASKSSPRSLSASTSILIPRERAFIAIGGRRPLTFRQSMPSQSRRGDDANKASICASVTSEFIKGSLLGVCIHVRVGSSFALSLTQMIYVDGDVPPCTILLVSNVSPSLSKSKLYLSQSRRHRFS